MEAPGTRIRVLTEGHIRGASTGPRPYPDGRRLPPQVTLEQVRIALPSMPQDNADARGVIRRSFPDLADSLPPGRAGLEPSP
jgi:hypothetical protein